mgnify:FL=1
MKTRSKALLLTLCAMLLLIVSSLGTVAYLTVQDTVTNTFSVGQVNITLDDVSVDKRGMKARSTSAPVDENDHILMPGHTYTKAHTIHVDAVSEDSYIFVKVENGIAGYEAASSAEEGGYKTINDQIKANGWAAFEGAANVYYREYTKSSAGSDFAVFGNFKIADNANDAESWGSYDAKVTVTAYAVQKDGFDTASDAWTATFGKTVDP